MRLNGGLPIDWEELGPYGIVAPEEAFVSAISFVSPELRGTQCSQEVQCAAHNRGAVRGWRSVRDYIRPAAEASKKGGSRP